MISSTRALLSNKIQKEESKDPEAAAASEALLKGFSPTNNAPSSIVREALQDSGSELNKFLDRKSKTFKSLYYPLALENCDLSTDKVILLCEAYAIFGALFFTVIFNLWEYGMAANMVIMKREWLKWFFKLSSALGLSGSVLMASYAFNLWYLSIMYSKSSPDFVYKAVETLSLLTALECFIRFITLILALCVMTAQFWGRWVQLAIVVVFLVGVYFQGNKSLNSLNRGVLSLVYVNMPRFLPLKMTTSKKVFSIVEKAAAATAEDIRDRAEREFISRDGMERSIKPENDLGPLLEKAAERLGFKQLNVAPYLQVLDKQMLRTEDSIKDLDMDVLARFMPYGLAKEVHYIIHKRNRGKEVQQCNH